MNSLLSWSMMVLYSAIIDHGVLVCSRLVMATLNLDLATANLEDGTGDFHEKNLYKYVVLYIIARTYYIGNGKRRMFILLLYCIKGMSFCIINI